ncbi:MAG TPA: sulfite exporter TauE/SafE family protein [Leucothrix mucor]|uniref:Probable membrane transporter protein n=1 Tax=Leucothrix mucor TaxID=45248 RepID=A0A7V2T101_LEUMU|nr:sulfite exporter TauE/SafE family protein [Leucothrix mucor]
MQEIINQFSTLQLIAIALIFIWTGFVRTGIGFGGAALGLPLLLLVDSNPIFFLPIIGAHLLFFTSITLSSRIHNVNWSIVGKVMAVIIIPKFIGILGLFNFPTQIVTIMVFLITLFYGLTWLFNYTIRSQSKWVDGLLLVLGGYVSGTSLVGAPLIAAVVMRYVKKTELRETLFILWFILVSFKMTTFVVYDVPLNWLVALWLLPFAAIGHFVGLKAHEYLVHSDSTTFHRVLGLGLIVVSSIGLVKVIW